MFRKNRDHLTVKRRPHDKSDQYQIEEQHRGLTDTMRGVAFCAREESAEDQRYAHGQLGYEIEIRLDASARAEKLAHEGRSFALFRTGRNVNGGCPAG